MRSWNIWGKQSLGALWMILGGLAFGGGWMVFGQADVVGGTLQIRGKELAMELTQQRPAVGFTNSGVFRMRNERGRRVELPVEIRTQVMESDWRVDYRTVLEGGDIEVLRVQFSNEAPPSYERWWEDPEGAVRDRTRYRAGKASVPYAGTDLWISDLGLEFLHWTDQRWVRRERSNGRLCDALDSYHSWPTTFERAGRVDNSEEEEGYRSVRSWIDAEYQALLRAEGYDARRILIKEFSVGSFRKIRTDNGEEFWMLKDIRIRDALKDRRTELIYDLPE